MASQSARSTPTKQPRYQKNPVPPIILRDKHVYSELVRIVNFQNIQFGSTQTKPERLAFFPPTPDDFRMIINILNDHKYGNHNFCPPEKRHLRIIIKSILESISVDEVRSVLMKLGFNPIYVERWKTKRGKPIAIVQLVVPREECRIFTVECIMHQVVKVQAQRSNPSTTTF
ncbi:hypothetical protein GWI33_016240 [Rhynchophorus ferrugineus]|uniref:Pre-C2HC domain-containing protein n=1 Tax=Rhynchophorus ferrugineus TaxID=354439 RepID=A0A834I205_RHYFE|nr:hypothetical protein GWI33_016240 [Rhynchophorus ferrugineus]